MADDTKDLLDGRAATYGDRVKNMDAVAKMVDGYLDGVEIRTGSRVPTGADFAMMMVLYKAYRFAVTPDYSDNINDVDGYSQIARECIEESMGMIDASSAQRYQELKAARDALIKEGFDPAKLVPIEDIVVNYAPDLIPKSATQEEGEMLEKWSREHGTAVADYIELHNLDDTELGQFFIWTRNRNFTIASIRGNFLEWLTKHEVSSLIQEFYRAKADETPL